MVDLSRQSWNFCALVQRLAADLDHVLCRPVPARSGRTVQRQRRLERNEIVQLITAYEAGATTYALAEQWRIDRRTVSDHVRRAGVLRPYRKLDPIQIPEATRLYLSGWSLMKLGDHFECNAETMRKALSDAGVPRRRPWERG